MSTHMRWGQHPARRIARATALLPLSLALAAGAAAQQPEHGPLLRVGETAHGTLSTSDDMLPDGSHFQPYRFHSVAGERVIITLASDDFDAYLFVGRWDDDEFEVLAADDDGAGGTHARIWWRPSVTGEYLIRASSLLAGETGRYAVSVAEAPPATPLDTGWAVPVRPGESHQGMLSQGDPILEDGSYYHLYSFEATVGERFVFTLRSDDFDAFLTVGWADGDTFIPLASDDDGAEGTDARLEWAAPGAGTYLVQANSYGAGETGRYTLTVQQGARR
jgi:hypothetical protein